MITSANSNKDLDSFPMLDYLFDEGITQVTDLIMFDTNYFVFVLEQQSLNLIIFSYAKFGTIYTSQDIAQKIDNRSVIHLIKGYSDGDYMVAGDYKYFFVTHETDELSGENFLRKYQILPQT